MVNIVSSFSKEAETSRNNFVEEELKKTSPVIAICCKDGLVLVTLTPFLSLWKIRPIHKKQGMVFGGIGEIVAVDETHEALVNLTHGLQLSYGPRDSNLREALKKILSFLYERFSQAHMRPLVISFLACKVLPLPIIYKVNWQGGISESRTFAVLGNNETATALQLKLQEKHSADLTVLEALDISRSLLLPYKEKGLQFEIGTVRISEDKAEIELKKEGGEKE